MLHTLGLFVWIVIITLPLGFLAIVMSVVTVGGNWSHRVARLWGRLILFASRIDVTVTGLDNIDPQCAYVYMANHQSNFDIPVILAHLPVQFRWLAKAELFKIPFFGLAMRRAGYISIERSNRRSAIKSLQKAAATVHAGVSVVIYPEGTRSRDGHIRKLKKGGFIMAIDAGVPIVPIIIRGTRDIMPRGALRIRPGRVCMQVKAPVPTEGFSRQTKEVLMLGVNEVIRSAFYQHGGEPSVC